MIDLEDTTATHVQVRVTFDELKNSHVGLYCALCDWPMIDGSTRTGTGKVCGAECGLEISKAKASELLQVAHSALTESVSRTRVPVWQRILGRLRILLGL